MDTKQLITGNPKEGFYPIVQDTVTIIELNEAVMNLTSESSSEDIAAAFDSVEGFNDLIENVRNSENIVNGILMNNDNAIGKIICTIAAYKNQYTCDIEYIYDGKIIKLDITNTDGTLSCIRKETVLGGGSQNNIKYISLNNIPDGTGTVNEDIITTLNTLQDRDILIGILDESKVAVVINYYMVNSKFYGYCVLPNWANAESIVINSLIINLNTKESSWNGVSIDTNGDGSKFLSDNGTYKTIEVGDKTNVLILSLENDLANGQKDSPVDAEVSTALKDAISNGKACVIKSANSDILANLQQIGDNVTIVMEQISRVGQTFVAVNTSITVNTATNVISDYQTGALVLETEGDGSKFLSNDGKYKEINSSSIVIPVDLRLDEILSNGGSGDGYDFSQIYNAYISGKTVYLKDSSDKLYLVINASDISVVYYAINTTGTYSSKPTLYWFRNVGYGGAVGTIYQIDIINDPDNILFKNNTTEFTPTGDYQPATKKYVDDNINDVFDIECNFDSNNLPLEEKYFTITGHHKYINIALFDNISSGTRNIFCIKGVYNNIDTNYRYRDSRIITVNNKTIKVDIDGYSNYQVGIMFTLIQRILTETEYSALGTTPNTDNVLYFVTPD